MQFSNIQCTRRNTSRQCIFFFFVLELEILFLLIPINSISLLYIVDHVRTVQYKKISVWKPLMSLLAVMMAGVMTMLFIVVVMTVTTEGDRIPTTLEGPFTPVTEPLANERFRIHPVDLPATDLRVLRNVTGFQPEQISVSLSAKYHSAWISWITGSFFFLFFFFLFRSCAKLGFWFMN